MICSMCAQDKSEDSYYMEYRQGRRRTACKQCVNAKVADRALLTRYGITRQDYDLMLKTQKGLCKICENPPKHNTPLYVDHDHETGKVRALLCQGCNTGIGALGEDLTVLEKAREYVIQHSRHPLVSDILKDYAACGV